MLPKEAQHPSRIPKTPGYRLVYEMGSSQAQGQDVEVSSSSADVGLDLMMVPIISVHQ